MHRNMICNNDSINIQFKIEIGMLQSDTLCGIKNTNGVLSIRKVILEIKRFMVDFADGVLEATPEL